MRWRNTKNGERNVYVQLLNVITWYRRPECIERLRNYRSDDIGISRLVAEVENAVMVTLNSLPTLHYFP